MFDTITEKTSFLKDAIFASDEETCTLELCIGILTSKEAHGEQNSF